MMNVIQLRFLKINFLKFFLTQIFTFCKKLAEKLHQLVDSSLSFRNQPPKILHPFYQLVYFLSTKTLTHSSQVSTNSKKFNLKKFF